MQNAQKIVSSTWGLAKNENSFNPLATISFLVLLVGVPALWIWALSSKFDAAAQTYNARMTAKSMGTYAYVPPQQATSTMFPWMQPPQTETPVPFFSATLPPTRTPPPPPDPATQTPYPTLTPRPTESYHTVFKFRYSYYNPQLGGANCALWDAANNTCASKMASGDDWRDWYGKALACPPEIALGTKFDVVFPEVLSGVWTCLDRGGAIVGDYVDFLDVAYRYAWNEPVIVFLYPPQVAVDQISPGSH